MTSFFQLLTVLILFSGLNYANSAQDLRRQIFEDALSVWMSFRDPDNGAWCDTLRLNQVPMVPCGQNNNFYSSAGTGIHQP